MLFGGLACWSSSWTFLSRLGCGLFPVVGLLYFGLFGLRLFGNRLLGFRLFSNRLLVIFGFFGVWVFLFWLFGSGFRRFAGQSAAKPIEEAIERILFGTHFSE